MKTARYQVSIVTLALLCISVSAPTAAAETLTLSLSQALATARERNPALTIAREGVAAAKGMHTQAGLIPNPVLTATSENQPFGSSPGFSFANQTDDYIYGSEMIELGGKRKRRLEATQAGIGIAGLEAEIATRRLLARVMTAYWTANAAARVRDLYDNEAATLRRMVNYSKARVHEGAAAEADLLRIQIEADRMLANANLASADANRSLIALYQEMAASDFPSEVTFTDSLRNLEHVDQPALETVLRERPEMQLAEARVKQAQANLSLERANAIPDPDLMFGYKRWSGYNQFSGINTMFFGVKTPLPLFNRNQGKIEAAQAGLRSAQLASHAQELTVRSEVASAQSDYLRSSDALARIIPVMSDRADRNLTMTREAYRLGGTDLIRYLDAERTQIETQVMYARTLSRYHESAVNLEYATGMIR